MIEQCGFKGKTMVGRCLRETSVGISEFRRCPGDEIALVAESIRTAVKDRFGIELMPEVKYVG